MTVFWWSTRALIVGCVLCLAKNLWTMLTFMSNESKTSTLAHSNEPLLLDDGLLIQEEDVSISNDNNNVIAYAISITQCQPEEYENPFDQSAILLYSIHLNSIRNEQSGSKYDYKAYAFIHPEASNCTEMFERIGYQVQVRESPVLKQEIKGPLKRYIHEASCCQEKEFLKLYSYTLLDHPIVVHLDIDYLIVQPLDDLFDTMMEGRTAAIRTKLQLQWDTNYTNLPDKEHLEAFFTRDYNMVNPGERLPHQVGVQGGFIVVKPNLDVFELYKATIIRGNYNRENGWGGSLQYGGYYGAAQIQGLCSYFFGAIRPGTSVELNKCYYNFMADKPRSENHNNQCTTMEKECQDCRTVPFKEIKTIHFTECTKPWWCYAHYEVSNRTNRLGGPVAEKVCLKAHAKWFHTRRLLEKAWLDRDESYVPSPVEKDKNDKITRGYCAGKYDYVRMTFPRSHVDF